MATPSITTDRELLNPIIDEPNAYIQNGNKHAELEQIAKKLFHYNSSPNGINALHLTPSALQSDLLHHAIMGVPEGSRNKCWNKLQPYLQDNVAAGLFSQHPTLLCRHYIKWNTENRTLAIRAPLLREEELELLWQKIPDEYRQKTEVLKLESCDNLNKLTVLQHFPNLKKCELKKCHKLNSLEGLAGCKQLTHLNIHHCIGLRDVKAVGNLTNLKEVRIERCESLKSVDALDGKELTVLSLAGDASLESLKFLGDTKTPKAMHNSLKELNLSGITGFTTCQRILPFKELRQLDISNTDITDLTPLFAFRDLVVIATAKQIAGIPEAVRKANPSIKIHPPTLV